MLATPPHPHPCPRPLQQGLNLAAGQQLAVAAGATQGRYVILYGGTAAEGNLNLDDCQVYTYGERALAGGGRGGACPEACAMRRARLGFPLGSSRIKRVQVRGLRACAVVVPARHAPLPVPASADRLRSRAPVLQRPTRRRLRR